ncbi:uncharacterized protein LOC111696378 [Eurytemora carolleeae]|uniref:uncharacterized protein LOC111696378 n=1 Tax=Eurytemora carolleeae TaxID=1294199 RepID=UPI000C79113D|nr:uncharacterized protein LOC111696378 [Eurytemora carolleeae]|eukprot:XP_023321739.1 uncharacterized protein LOC111696378 [Eurytemora affinis]
MKKGSVAARSKGVRKAKQTERKEPKSGICGVTADVELRNLETELDLEYLHHVLPVSSNSSRANPFTVWIKSETINIFKHGKLVIFGAKSVEIARKRLRQVVRMIQKYDDRCRGVSLAKIRIRNVIFNLRLDLIVNLQKLCQNYQDARYEPEVDLNCVRFKFQEKGWKGHAAVFFNGKVVIQSNCEDGATNISEKIISILEINDKKNKSVLEAGI